MDGSRPFMLELTLGLEYLCIQLFGQTAMSLIHNHVGNSEVYECFLCHTMVCYEYNFTITTKS
jgi:hypothetical protein